jgi:ribosomal protein S18 acetylase RimI-like enzyme
VARAQVRVRDAQDEDLEQLALWWDDVRAGGARLGPFSPPTDDNRFRERVAAVRSNPRQRLLVAESGGELVGLAVLSLEPVSPMNDAEAVQICVLHVRDGARRRGVGRALIAESAQIAAELDAEYVTVAALPQARESNRFFARLGFTPLVVRRAVPTPVLQRRLVGHSEPVRHLVARRRRAGRRVESRATAHVTPWAGPASSGT